MEVELVLSSSPSSSTLGFGGGLGSIGSAKPVSTLPFSLPPQPNMLLQKMPVQRSPHP